MSEKLLKILLEELQLVRVVCGHELDIGRVCGAVSEVPIDHLPLLKTCPSCGHALKDMRNANSFRELVAAINELKKDQFLKFQFVLPAKD